MNTYTLEKITETRVNDLLWLKSRRFNNNPINDSCWQPVILKVIRAKFISVCYLMVLLTLFLPFRTQAGIIEIKGAYQGENLYVKNPFSAVGVGFCVFEVTVNGTTTTDEINSSAFEIDLTVFELYAGEPVVVRINHRDGCTPRVLNPGVLNPRATFQIVELNLAGDRITWTTRDESGSLPFIVEQFRWNKWVNVGEVPGKGLPGRHSYSMPVRLHSGENRFRVRQTDENGSQRLSPQLFHRAEKQPVSFSTSPQDNNIIFSVPTMYEIFDGRGRLVTRGYGDRVSIEELNRGSYFLNFDNQMRTFQKR